MHAKIVKSIRLYWIAPITAIFVASSTANPAPFSCTNILSGMKSVVNGVKRFIRPEIWQKYPELLKYKPFLSQLPWRYTSEKLQETLSSVTFKYWRAILPDGAVLEFRFYSGEESFKWPAPRSHAGTFTLIVPQFNALKVWSGLLKSKLISAEDRSELNNLREGDFFPSLSDRAAPPLRVEYIANEYWVVFADVNSPEEVDVRFQQIESVLRNLGYVR